MKFRTLNKWTNVQQSYGLILFAQLLEELLFDYSLDTYKSSVMHTGTLCTEAILTLNEIEAGNIMAPNLGHVLKELCANYEKDEVAKSLVSLDPSSFLGTLKNPNTPHGETRVILELLQLDLGYPKYKAKNEELLVLEIEGSQDPARIRRLTRSYITTLTSGGYSHKHISETAQDFFHYKPGSILGNSSIRDFLKIFDDAKQKYTFIYKANGLFDSISQTARRINIAICNALPTELNQAANLLPLAQRGELYVISKEIAAKDRYIAREFVEAQLKLLQTLLNLFHHKECASWNPECVIHDHQSGGFRKVKSRQNPMFKCVDRRIDVAGAKVDKLAQEFSLENESFAKFVRSALLHTMAIKSDSIENQILNLWISLESLVPSESKSANASNIEHIVDSLIPFLNIDYMRRLLSNLVKDILNWDYKAGVKAFKNVDGPKFHDKLARILVLPQYATNLVALESCIKDFHLLRDRIEHFKNLLSSPKNVLSSLEAHKVRLEWQIRRIYRTRNIIVHSGKTPPFTQQLIEHSHDYLDTVLYRLVRLASSPQKIKSVSQGFKYTELHYKSYIRNLEGKGVCFTNENMSDLIFAKI